MWFAEALKWMRACHERKQPFFVYLPLNAARGPLFVSDKYREPYRNQPRNVASFYGTIANIDENMGKLDAWLGESGLRDNTIVIFMTDNGATAGANAYNAGMRGRKMELYEGGHRVPCFIRWPAGKLRLAADVPDLTQIQDLLPTLIDLCRLKRPANAQFDGSSLAGLLRGEPLRDRRRVAASQRTHRGT